MNFKIDKIRIFEILFICLVFISFFVGTKGNFFNSYSKIKNVRILDYWFLGSIDHSRKHNVFTTYTFTVAKSNKKSRFQDIEGLSDKLITKDGKWRVYLSAVRWPNLVHKLMANYLLPDTNIPDLKRLAINMSAFFSSLILCLLIFWVYKEFDIFSSISVLILLLFSDHIMNWSTCLVHPLTFFLLPFLLGLLKFRNVLKPKKSNIYLFTAFTVFLAQTLNYSCTVIVCCSAILPIVYYYLNDKNFISIILAAAAGAITGVILAFIVHIVFLGLYLNDFSEGFDFIKNRFYKRSSVLGNHVNEINVASQDKVRRSHNTKYFPLLKKYLITYPIVFKLKPTFFLVAHLLSIFGMSFLVKTKVNLRKSKSFKLLVIASLSLIAVLLNLYLFKPHASIHTFIDLIWWSFPYTIVVTLLVIQLIKESYNLKIPK